MEWKSELKIMRKGCEKKEELKRWLRYGGGGDASEKETKRKEGVFGHWDWERDLVCVGHMGLHVITPTLCLFLLPTFFFLFFFFNLFH